MYSERIPDTDFESTNEKATKLQRSNRCTRIQAVGRSDEPVPTAAPFTRILQAHGPGVAGLILRLRWQEQFDELKEGLELIQIGTSLFDLAFDAVRM